MAYQILVVDDEKLIVKGIKFSLEQDGMEVTAAYDGEEALQNIKEKNFDLVVLDVMLPKMDGLEVCQQTREFSQVPIIMVTAKGEDMDKIMGLEYGADDYVTKPFSVRELMARIKANLRKADITSNVISEENRKQEDNTNKIIVGDLSLDLDKFEVRVKNEVMDLTLREFEVLKYLASQPGQVVTRETLLEKVWGYEYYGDIRTVDVTVRRIREKIEKDTSNPKILITKRGVGYYIAS